MKHLYTRPNLYILFILLSTCYVLVSCGTYQSAYNNDGIYGDTQEVNTYKKVIVVNEKEYEAYEDNYFLKKFNSLERIKSDGIFTEVEGYSSVDTIYESAEIADRSANYAPNQPWGMNDDNDVVINVDVNRNPYWSDFYGYGFYNNWRYRNWGYNPYGWRYRGYDWGFRNYNWGYRGFGWNADPFWSPFQNYYAWNPNFYTPYHNDPFYNRFGNPYRGFNSWNNAVNDRNINYGRRTASNRTYRRDNPTSSRTRTGRRSSVPTNQQLEKSVRERYRKIKDPKRRKSITRKNSSSRRSYSRSKENDNNSSSRRSYSRSKENNSNSSSRRSYSRSRENNNNSSSRRSYSPSRNTNNNSSSRSFSPTRSNRSSRSSSGGSRSSSSRRGK